MAKACLPKPGILFQFRRGGDVVDMPVCLECSIFMIDYEGNRREAKTVTRRPPCCSTSHCASFRRRPSN